MTVRAKTLVKDKFWILNRKALAPHFTKTGR